MTDEPKLTPTQDLIMCAVAARFRLGEPFWTIARRNLQAIEGLEALGLVTWRHHNASSVHVYVTLTAAGRAMYVTADYVPPICNEDRIARAIGDPGSVVGSRDPGESVTRWSARAVVVTLLGEDGPDPGERTVTDAVRAVFPPDVYADLVERHAIEARAWAESVRNVRAREAGRA